MAGNYPDVPGPRMAYHLDGSVLFANLVNGVWSNPIDQVTNPTSVAQLNDEGLGNIPLGSPGSTYTQACRYGIIFPELRDLSGILIGLNDSRWSNGPALQWSPDTTNLIDGTWSATGGNPVRAPVNTQQLRTSITALALNGVRALRWTAGKTFGGPGFGMNVLHIYGRISNMQLDRRLRLWHPTLDEEVSGHYFDLGDIARGSADSIDFRVKNHSEVEQATDTTVGITHPTNATPTMAPQLLLSTASSPSQEGSKAIGTLAPEAISEVITLHRATDPAAALSLWWSLIAAQASHWDPPE